MVLGLRRATARGDFFSRIRGYGLLGDTRVSPSVTRRLRTPSFLQWPQKGVGAALPRRTGTQCTSVRPQTARSCAARASQRRPMASQARCRSGRLRRAACRPQPLTLRLSAAPPQRRLHSGLCGAGAGLGPPRRGWRLAAAKGDRGELPGRWGRQPAPGTLSGTSVGGVEADFWGY